MVRAARRLRLLGVTVAASLALLAACSTRSEIPGDQPSAVTSTLPAASSSPQLPKDGRPLAPIPKVRPKGFTEPPPGRGLARYENQQIEWESCGHGFFCGTLLVPLDYHGP